MTMAAGRANSRPAPSKSRWHGNAWSRSLLCTAAVPTSAPLTPPAALKVAFLRVTLPNYRAETPKGGRLWARARTAGGSRWLETSSTFALSPLAKRSVGRVFMRCVGFFLAVCDGALPGLCKTLLGPETSDGRRGKTLIAVGTGSPHRTAGSS